MARAACSRARAERPDSIDRWISDGFSQTRARRAWGDVAFRAAMEQRSDLRRTRPAACVRIRFPDRALRARIARAARAVARAPPLAAAARRAPRDARNRPAAHGRLFDSVSARARARARARHPRDHTRRAADPHARRARTPRVARAACRPRARADRPEPRRLSQRRGRRGTGGGHRVRARRAARDHGGRAAAKTRARRADRRAPAAERARPCTVCADRPVRADLVRKRAGRSRCRSPGSAS
ncbi:putative membrane protein [Burkholderia pseudomallei MSHR511]|nr:putative membrane protein [Burkholderia pseudomallei NAU20B-16]AHG35419.1 putative membrane protein [Burkholderia pseudomallei MSHR511]AHG69139.1 putative membrane protein [Burkholderia pseudomallei MSHR146]KGW27521.1 putative membrane protein [Burkholderia pseudomallei MSHR3016]